MIENVTVVFTDLVGSTALSARLAPEAADELRQRHFAVLRDAVAGAGGTEVKNLGDGLMVVFATASAAVSCAVAMQQLVDRDNQSGGHQLWLRIGVSGGEVVREGDDYFGDPVVEAARVCARADGGQILAAQIVKVTAGRRSRHPFRAVGSLELKGLPEPLDTFEVGWESLEVVGGAPAVIPLPPRLAARPGVGVIGRQVERDLLAAARKRVTAGEGPEVMLIAGEAGAGKTTLVADAAREAFESGACVLLGSCDEEGGVSYKPFADALGHYVAHAPVTVLAAHVTVQGGELARLTPGLHRRVTVPGPQGLDPDTERFLLFGAVVALLTQACADQPLVLVIDDLQWADAPSLRLLRHVVASAEPTRLLVVGTHRSIPGPSPSAWSETVAALQRERGIQRIKLRGLDDGEVVSLMEAAAGHALGPAGIDLAHAVHRETDGNPFFVTEVLRHLSETGAIYQAESGDWLPGADLAEIGLPDSVRDVVGARVNRLGDDARQVLSVAAVIGRSFDLELLARSTERPESQLLDVLDAAIGVALVHEVADAPNRFRFSHALVQHTLYQDLGATRRARTHRVVAEALEDVSGDRPGSQVGELARHWLNATQPVDQTKALKYLRQAADASLAALAPDDAIEYYRKALDLAEQLADADPRLVVEVLIGLGTAQRQLGMSEFRKTLLDAAHRAARLGATDLLVDAAVANNRGIFSILGAPDEEKLNVLEAALRAMPTADSVERALLLATQCSEFSFGSPLDQRRSIAAVALDMARRLADPACTLRVLNLVEPAIRVPATLSERMAHSAEALDLAEDLGDPVALYWSLLRRRTTTVEAGAFETATECLERARPLSEQLRQPMLSWHMVLHEAADSLLKGDSADAERKVTKAFEIADQSGQPDAFAYYAGQLTVVRLQQGRLAELRPALTEIVSDNLEIPAYAAALALAHIHADARDEAARLLDAAADDQFASVPVNAGWADCLVGYGEVAVELRATDVAACLIQYLAPYPEQVPFDGIVPLDPISFFLGSLLTVTGDLETAAVHLRTAAELNARAGAKFSQARTDHAWGRLLALRDGPGDRLQAQEHLERARDAAATHGYGRVERQATAGLALLG